MAIVPDKSGTRPGRPGNIPASDPRNRSTKERMVDDDTYEDEVRFTLSSGNTLVLQADKTRNQLLFVTPEASSTIFVSALPMSSANGVPVYGGAGLQIRGKAAELTYYVYATQSVSLSILIG